MADLPPYPGDQYGTIIGEVLFADYGEAGQSPNPGMGVWFLRTTYDYLAGLPLEVSIAKHRIEWRLALGLPAFNEAPIAPREYSGNLCGIRQSGLSPVPGGSSDPTLVLSWFYDRYSGAQRQVLRDAWRARGQYDVLLSWPDSRAVGKTPNDFAATCVELYEAGLRPCVMLLSKDFDPHHNQEECLRRAEEILPWLLTPRRASRICIGWELSLWLSPSEVQFLVDHIALRCQQAGVKTYVHFQEGFSHFDEDGPNASFAGYWNRQVGKLTGLLHQRRLTWSEQEYAFRLDDITIRFSGGFNTVPDNGFGQPFDCVAFEITAERQFNGGMSEEEGNRWGRIALQNTSVYQGPLGPVRVMGSGNGS